MKFKSFTTTLKLKSTLLLLFLCLKTLHASSPPHCHSYFLHTDLFESLSDSEKTALKHLAFSYASILDVPLDSSRDLRARIDQEFQTLLSLKKLEKKEQEKLAEVLRAYFLDFAAQWRESHLEVRAQWFRDFQWKQDQIQVQNKQLQKQHHLQAILDKYKTKIISEAFVRSGYPNKMNRRQVDTPEIEFLLQMGADINSVDSAQGRTALMAACDKSDITTVRFLIRLGAGLNLQDKKEKTALMLASIKDNKAVAQVLLEAGAEIDLQDQDGNTAFMLAVKNNRLDMANFLLQNGADKNATNNEDQTILMAAVLDQREHIIPWILDLALPLEFKDMEGQTALLLASQKGTKKIFQLLVDAGADIEAIDNAGQTPFLVASESGKESIVVYLLGKGVNKSHSDNEGMTALMCASAKGYKDMAGILLEAGLDMSLKTHDGRTALSIAKAHKASKIVTLLEEHDRYLRFKHKKR